MSGTTIELDYEPLPVHAPFHHSKAKHRCLIGALGSGKSLAMNMEIIRLCFAYPGLRAVIMRRFVPELRDSTEAAFFEALPAELNTKQYVRKLGGHVDHITFPNGSRVEFRGAEDPDKFKALADDQPVLTPTGWRPMGELCVGDEVVGGSAGVAVRVRAVHPQGVRQMYRVTLKDGASVETDAAHLWTVGRAMHGTRVEKLVRTCDLNSTAKTDRLPTQPVVEYGLPDPAVPGYTLGALLGDGGLTQMASSALGFTCRDEDALEVVGRLRDELGAHAISERAAPMQYGILASRAKPLFAWLRAAGLAGTGSRSKFVPEAAKRGSVAYRAALLQGLMDTDGTAGAANVFCSVSERLAADVLEVARSLACVASMSRYENAFGPYWHVRVVPPRELEVFHLRRKVARTFRYTRSLGRYVSAVEPTRLAACTCIEVDDPQSLFVCKDFIVTHNSIEYGLIAFDEVDQIPEADVRAILRRLRQTTPLNGAKLPRGVKMPNISINASNPAGKNWVWGAFVEGKDAAWPDASVHLSTSLDNPFLPADYLDLLLTYPLPVIRRIVYCSFDDAGGLVYPEWQWGKHVVPVQPVGHFGSLVYMGADPGMMAPTAGLWVEVDPARQRMTAIAEYQVPDLAAPDHAANWRVIEKARQPLRVTRRIADPNISKRDQGTGTPLADIYAKLGFSFERGPVRQETRIPQLQEAIRSGRFQATEACPRLHEQITKARWEDNIPKLRDLSEYREKMRKHEDHIHDCAQYLAGMHIPTVAAGMEGPPAPISHDEVMAAWERERRAALAAQVRRNGARSSAPRDGCVV